MAINIQNEVWAHAPVQDAQLTVLLALAERADPVTRRAFPGIKELAFRARRSERHVKRSLAALEEVGLIRVKQGASPYRTNLYTITNCASWPARTDASAKFSDEQFGVGGDTHGTSEVTPMSSEGDTHVPSGVTPMSPLDGGGVTPMSGRGDTHVPSEVTPMSPKPPVTPITTIAPSDQPFEKFWEIYPRSANRQNARDQFDKLVDDGVSPDRLIAAAGEYATSTTGSVEAYVQFAENFLSKGSWKEYADRASKRPVKSTEDQIVQFWVEKIKAQPPKPISPTAFSPSVGRAMVEAGLVALEELKSRNLPH